MEQRTGSKLGKKYIRLYTVTLLIYPIHHAECWAGWSTSWSQAGWRKYQHPQIHRWYHSNGRKWRGTKEPLDEGGRREWIEGGKVERVTDFIFRGSKVTAGSDCGHEIKRHLLLGRKAMTNLDSILKSRNITFPKKVCIVKASFSSGHVQLRKLDCKEGWALKNWWFWTVVLKTLESPLDSKKIKPVNPIGNQPWIFIRRTDAEAEALATWCKEPTHWKFWCWERWRQEEKGMAENEMIRQYHWFHGHESEQTPGDSGGQRSLACHSSRGHKVSATT